jgi:16S rRNA (cytidine1402-2'-O)-methyltransferase
MISSTLILAGTPLDEDAPLSASTRQAAEGAGVIVGESRGVMMRYLKAVPGLETKALFCLDPPRKDTLELILEALTELSKTGGTALLISDTGMPVLFDPGAEVLAHCRKLGFRVRSAEGATSWGMACALSGWEPPFLVVGFPPRDTEERRDFLAQAKESPGHLVLMDTPYRFQALLDGAMRALGGSREAFLAWEITRPSERLLWGTLGELTSRAKQEGLEKGEFVLLIKSAPRRGRR